VPKHSGKRGVEHNKLGIRYVLVRNEGLNATGMVGSSQLQRPKSVSFDFRRTAIRKESALIGEIQNSSNRVERGVLISQAHPPVRQDRS
jgi:hypothetical protein